LRQLRLGILDAGKLPGADLVIGRRICDHNLFDLVEHGFNSTSNHFGRGIGCNQLCDFVLAAFDQIETHLVAHLRRTQGNAGFFDQPFHWIERHPWQRIRSHGARHAKDHHQEDRSHSGPYPQSRDRKTKHRPRASLVNFAANLTPDSVHRLRRRRRRLPFTVLT
jgi:hypothetical protein